MNENSPHKNSIWISKDGKKSIRFDLVQTTWFCEDSRSKCGQTLDPKYAEPTFSSAYWMVYGEDALQAYEAWKQYHGIL